jgi:polyhydroxyalkanoate synthase subunit PhaC
MRAAAARTTTEKEKKMSSPKTALNRAGAAATGAGSLDAATSPAARALALQAFAQAARPDRVAGPMLELWADYFAVLTRLCARASGLPVAPAAAPADRRFADPAWTQNAWFEALHTGYAATARAVLAAGEAAPGLDDAERRKAAFFTRQVLDALAPANFPWSNPVVLREAVATGGASVARGLLNLLGDIDPYTGRLRVSMSDERAWEVGRNLAVTPGKVVWQNDLMQLIQYAPRTETVARRPLLIVPPWLNKYYILDLQPDNSMVRWLVENGHTVFVISWVNPDASHAGKTFDDYLLEGPIAALDAIERATGEREVNAVGYCLGGILLAIACAWLAARGERGRIRSATLLTALLDYTDVGEIRAFVDDEEITRLEQRAARTGSIPGDGVAWGFRMLRPRDLVWSFWIDHYLRGKDYKPFDLLYWNADATNMPLRAHAWFMRRMYVENRLREPGGLTLASEPIDLAAVRVPAYVVGTREDHIAPWRGVHESARLLSGPVRFVLGDSGHIAGIVNPPARGKYAHRVADGVVPDPDAWLAQTPPVPGSWWPDWQRWLARHAGGRVPARPAGSRKLPGLEDAPGSYVRRRIAP